MFAKRSQRRSSIGYLCLLAIASAVIGSFWMGAVGSAHRRVEHSLQSATDGVFRLSIKTNDIVYNPDDQMIYASRPSTADDEGNSITRINPVTGDIGASVYVGSEPNKLAISDSGKSLYVAIDGAIAVRHYDTELQTPGKQFWPHRSSSSSPKPVTDLSVAPADPDTVVVAASGAHSDRQITAFRNGIQLPQTSMGAEFVVFSDPSTIYGGGSYQTALKRYSLTESGITDDTGSSSSIWVSSLKAQNGLIFDSTGHVLDSSNGNLLGTFVGVNSEPNHIRNTFAFVPDLANGRVFYAVKTHGSITIKAFDINTFLEIGSTSINDTGSDTYPMTMVRYGSNGLALRTNNDQIFFIRTSLIPTDEPLPEPTAIPATPTPLPTPQSYIIREISIPNRDLIYRSVDRKLYASIPGEGGENADSLVRIDPSTATIENAVFIGSDPGRLGFSYDEQTMYIGLDGENSVIRYEMESQSLGPQFPLGIGVNGPKTAYDIEVFPGNPNSVAVSYGSSLYNQDGVDIFDHGVKRTQHGDRSGGIMIASPDTLFVGDDIVSKYTVTSSGLSLEESFVLNSPGEAILIENLLYTAGGLVIDVVTKEVKGRFTGVGYFAAVAVDQPNNRIFFLSRTSDTDSAIRAYRLDNYLPAGYIALPGVRTSRYGGVGRRLLRWGQNGLAFTDFIDRIYLLQSDLVSSEGTMQTGLRLSTQEPIGNEGSGVLSVKVERFGRLTDVSTVDYSTSDGTARGGIDYAVVNGTLTFGPGERFKTIKIPVIDDIVYEGGEIRDLSIVLTNPAGGDIAIHEPSTLRFTISDNDPPPSIQGANITVYEPHGTEISEAVFTLKLSHPAAQPVTIYYSTNNGTAIGGLDYIPVAGGITFAPLETTKTVAVQISSDDEQESNEFFRLSLSVVNESWMSTALLVATIVQRSYVTVSGRVVTPDGRGLRDATVVIVDSSGVRRQVITSTLGYYSFESMVTAGAGTVVVISRRYRFAQRQMTFNGSLPNVDFIGLE